MLIESLIKRAGGTQVTLEGKTYHFAPTTTDDRHLADVLIQAHAERFLSISEGYRYAGEAEDAPQSEQTPAPVNHGRMPRTSLTHAAYFDVGDTNITLQELTLAAQRESGLTVEEWNAQEDQDLYEWLDTTLDELREAAAVQAEEQRNSQAPERGVVIQPEPEEGLGDDDEAEELRKAVDAEMGAGKPEGDDNQSGEQSNGDGKPAADQGAAKPEASGDGDGKAITLPSREELDAAYKEKMGRNPSKQLSDLRVYQLLHSEED